MERKNQKDELDTSGLLLEIKATKSLKFAPSYIVRETQDENGIKSRKIYLQSVSIV